jgi:carbon-monoxide dehydrogenase catalytic subunit
MKYTYEERKEISRKVVERAVAAYNDRKGKFSTNPVQLLMNRLSSEIGCQCERVNPMQDHGYSNAITGVTEVTLKEFLGGSYQPLIDLLASGKIKGVVGIVGCSNLRAKGHDVFTVELAKELIAKDILVLAAGCTCGGLENCGLMCPEAAEMAGDSLKEVCKSLGIPPVLNFGPCLAIGRMELVAGELAEMLNIDIPQLPIVLSAPQWLEEQALADGVFALALGFNLHLGLPPFVTGSPVIHDVLANQMEGITGGKLFVETDIKKTADKMEEIISQKRSGLGI